MFNTLTLIQCRSDQCNLNQKIVLRDSSKSYKIITKEFQRERAKDVASYFKIMKRDKQISDDKILGWTPGNEITNGRWVMIGLLIGFLTEYATGVNFIDQIKLTVSYLGIVDVID